MSVVLSQLRWPSLAQSLALMMVPGTPITELGVVCREYNISEKEVTEILKVPQFQELFKQSLATFKSQGTKAASIYRAHALSTSLFEKLYNQSMDDKLDAKESVKLLELLLKVGGLLDSKGDSVAVNVQTNIALPLPTGLKNPKIRHLQPAIDTEATSGV